MKVALIAHDGKKADLVSFVIRNKEYLNDAQIFTTATTGSHVENAGFKITKVLSGPLGGDAQIAAMVAERKLDMVIFFRDPMGKHPHELRCCSFLEQSFRVSRGLSRSSALLENEKNLFLLLN